METCSSVSKRAGWIQERLVELVRELAQEGRRSGEPVERLTARWEEELPDEDFWEEVRRRLDSELQPYRQTAFLRERTEEEQAPFKKFIFCRSFFVFVLVLVLENRNEVQDGIQQLLRLLPLL